MAGEPLKEHNEPIGRPLSGGQAKQLINEAGFACRSRRSQDAMAHIDFRGGAVMDGVLTIVTWPKEMRGASMTLAQEVRRGDEVLVAADVMVAAVRGGRAVRIPDELRAALTIWAWK